jgi:hypothetical protein
MTQLENPHRKKRVAFWRAKPTDETASRAPFRSLTDDPEARAAAEQAWRRHLERTAPGKKSRHEDLGLSGIDTPVLP